MRINQLTIYGFGKFHDTQVQFDAQLQVIYGPNEAGKTTLVASLPVCCLALRQLSTNMPCTTQKMAQRTAEK